MDLVTNPQSNFTAAPREKLAGVDDTVAFETTQVRPRAKTVVAHQYRLLGPPRGKHLLYGVLAGLAACLLQAVITDRFARDEPDRAASRAAPLSASAHVNPQFVEKVPQPANEKRPESIGQPKLTELLTRARHQIESLALTSPPGDNALETLQEVLAAIPSQPDALQGIKDIASKYAMLADQTDKRGERDLAKRYLDKGLRLVPDHPGLLAVQRRLAQPTFELRPPTVADRLRMAPNQPAGTSK